MSLLPSDVHMDKRYFYFSCRSRSVLDPELGLENSGRTTEEFSGLHNGVREGVVETLGVDVVLPPSHGDKRGMGRHQIRRTYRRVRPTSTRNRIRGK